MFSPTEILGNLVIKVGADASQYMATTAAVEARMDSMVRNITGKTSAITGSIVGGFEAKVGGVIASVSRMGSGVVSAMSSAAAGANGILRNVASSLSAPISVRIAPLIEMSGLKTQLKSLFEGVLSIPRLFASSLMASITAPLMFAQSVASRAAGVIRGVMGTTETTQMVRRQIRNTRGQFTGQFEEVAAGPGELPGGLLSSMRSRLRGMLSSIGRFMKDEAGTLWLPVGWIHDQWDKMILGMGNSWRNFWHGFGGGAGSRFFTQFGRGAASAFQAVSDVGRYITEIPLRAGVAWQNFWHGFGGGRGNAPITQFGRWVSNLGPAIASSFQSGLVHARVAWTNFRIGVAQMGGFFTGGVTPPAPPPGGWNWATTFGQNFAKVTQSLGPIMRAVFSIPATALQGALRIVVGIGEQIGSMALGFRRMSLILGVPAGIFNVLALRSFTNLDKEVTNTVAVMAGYDVNIRRSMEQLTTNIAVRTTTSASDMAKGLYTLVTAGLTAAQSMQYLGEVEKFAVAGMMSMEKAANVLVSTQNTLGLMTGNSAQDFENLQRVMNVMTKAAILSNATISGMTESFTHKASSALTLVNKTIEEGAAILAVYSSRGITGALAGERLAILIRDLQGAEIRAGFGEMQGHINAWKALGIVVFDAQQKMLPIADIIGQLENKMKHMTDREKREMLVALRIPDRSVHAILPLLGYSQQIRGLEQSLTGLSGTVDNVYRIMLTSFSAQLEILRNNLAAVGFEIGKILAPVLNRLNEILRAGLQWWRSLPDAMKESMVMLGAFVVVALPLLWILSGVLSLLMGIIAHPIDSLISAGVIGTTLAFLARFITDSGGIAKVWDNAKENMGGFFEDAIGFLGHFQENFDRIIKWFGDNWENMITGAMEFSVRFIGESISKIIQNFPAIFSGLGSALINVLRFVLTSAFRLLHMIGDEIIAKFKDVVKNIIPSIFGARAAAEMNADDRGIVGSLIERNNRILNNANPLITDTDRMQAQGSLRNNLRSLINPPNSPEENERQVQIRRDLNIPAGLSGNRMQAIYDAFVGAVAPPPATITTSVAAQQALVDGVIDEERARMNRLNNVTTTMTQLGGILNYAAGGWSAHVPPFPLMNTSIARPTITPNQWTAANAAGIIGQGALGVGGLPAWNQGINMRVLSMQEQATVAATAAAMLVSPLAGLGALGGARFNLAYAGMKIGAPYDERETQPYERPTGAFESIALRRFILETPSGVAAMPPKVQNVHDQGVIDAIDRLNTPGGNQAETPPGQFGTIPRGR